MKWLSHYLPATCGFILKVFNRKVQPTGFILKVWTGSAACLWGSGESVGEKSNSRRVSEELHSCLMRRGSRTGRTGPDWDTPARPQAGPTGPTGESHQLNKRQSWAQSQSEILRRTRQFETCFTCCCWPGWFWEDMFCSHRRSSRGPNVKGTQPWPGRLSSSQVCVCVRVCGAIMCVCVHDQVCDHRENLVTRNWKTNNQKMIKYVVDAQTDTCDVTNDWRGNFNIWGLNIYLI